MPIKSVHITNYYHKTSGGISTAYNHLLEAANRHRRYVRLIVPGEVSTFEDIGEFGRIYYVKAGFSPVFDKRYRLMMPWSTYLLENAPIKKILRDEDPEIIEIGEKYTLSLMAGLHRKYILTVGSKRPMLVQFSCERMDDNVRAFMSGGRFAKWLARRYTANYTLPMYDFHLTNSDYTAQEFFDAFSADKDPHRSNRFFNLCWRFMRAPKIDLRDRVFVNQCGVDNITFDPARKDATKRDAIIAEYGISQNAKLILYAGRISPEKNTGLLLDTLVELTANSNPEFCLLIAGGGPSADKFAEEAKTRTPGKVIMIGHITDKDKLADLFANCDVFVHPNPREPFGITPLEAMASGLPVVAPNSGGLLSYANVTNAWLMEPAGSEFASAIKRLLGDDAIRNKKIAEGLATANRYDWDKSTDALFALYDKMYADFISRNELYDYRKSPSSIDFSKPIDPAGA